LTAEHKNKSCATCAAPLAGEYCHECGEKIHYRHEFALLHYTREIFYQITHIDAKIFKTLQLLITRPGQLTE